NVSTEAGQALRAEACALLQVVGRPDDDAITLADLARRTEVLSDLGLNGDGVVPEAAADDPATAALIQQVIDTVGGVADHNGKLGVDASHAQQFFEQAQALQDWRQRAVDDPALTPLDAAGTLTEGKSRAAASALAAVREKVDDHFLRCRLADYDTTAVAALNPPAETYRAWTHEVLKADTAELAKLPLATSAALRPLPLRAQLNPAWAARIDTFRSAVVEPLLLGSPDALSEAAWQHIKERLQPCTDWLATRPDTALDALPPEALQALLADNAAAAKLAALIARDAEAGPANDRILGLEKLLRFQRDLVHLLNNFVSFSEFYSRRGAIFEAGTLYLDARSCELAVNVADAKRHATLAGLARAYLAYCDCSRDGQKMGIVAAFTAGDTDFLFVGRNGVFYDRKGNDWDATITKVIESPTSIRQAFFLPYKKFVRLIEETAAKRAAASDQRSSTLLTDVATRTVNIDKAAPKPGTPAPAAVALAGGAKSRIDVGTVAALGVALGSISTVLVAVFGRFIELGWWIPVGVLGIVLAISGPSMLIAWLKLRQRSLGPILDASGWAINGRMHINVPLGGSLTQTAQVPGSAERRLRDPFAPTHSGRTLLLLGLLLTLVAWAAWRFGWLHRFAVG
ncbi:MAG: hypothetical protein ABIN96_15340, partial [Rubrivivax sp.]